MGGPANPDAVQQLKLTRDVINETRALLKEFRQHKQVLLDNTEAVDSLKETLESVAQQFAGTKVDVIQETVEDAVPGTEPDRGGR